MLNRRRSGPAALRFAARRQREDEAPRLHDEVPRLRHLRLEVEERRGGGIVPEAKHIRHVIIDRAPALFLLPCGDASCNDGGHDVTLAMMRDLRAGQTRFEGESVCNGTVGTALCGRVVHYVAIADYDPSAK
jgi:hypothetical protein